MPAIALLFVCLLLTACSSMEIKPGEKSHARREMAPGAGLLTGSEGEFVIFRLEDKGQRGDSEDGREKEPKASTSSE